MKAAPTLPPSSSGCKPQPPPRLFPRAEQEAAPRPGRERAWRAERQIAIGTPPEPGRDGWVEVSFEQGALPGQVGADGRMDFVERGLLKVVEAQRVVAILHAPEPGRTAPALCVQEDLVIEDCLRLMRMSGVRSVPVVRGLTPVGILSFTDVPRQVAG